MSAEARAYVSTLPRLRGMPHVAQRIRSAANDSRTTAHELAECVALDPAITVQLLRFANEATGDNFATAGVRDLVSAIVVLGYETAAELVLAATRRDLDGESRETKREWRRTMLVASAASRLARAVLENRGAQETFIAGMLHDMGRNALRQKQADVYEDIFSADSGQHLAPGVAEATAYARCSERLGFHPGDIGAALAEQWKLAPEIAVVARYHHDADILYSGSLSGEEAILLWLVQGGKLVADAVLHGTVAVDGPTRLRHLLNVPQFRGNMASQFARAWYTTYARAASLLTPTAKQ